MTPKRKKALKWCRDDGITPAGAPTVAMIDRLSREGLVEYHPRTIDYNASPEGKVIPAGYRLTQEGECALAQAD